MISNFTFSGEVVATLPNMALCTPLSHSFIQDSVKVSFSSDSVRVKLLHSSHLRGRETLNPIAITLKNKIIFCHSIFLFFFFAFQ
jgi:hypothetical protein